MLAPSTTIVSLALIAVAQANNSHSFMKIKREVPQEHSHEQFLVTVRSSLQLNNPDRINDPVFGLLGAAAAAGGAGQIQDLACLQQATADQAFTNAKAKGDVNGMTAALVYRSLERNTGKVGLASVPCTSVVAKNKEIGALVQHQDPASPNAAALNKAATLALAKQIASIGGDPQIALKAGTFAPGDLSDNTGRGNTCDTQDDPIGCIFTQNKIVFDATPEEISAAVAGVAAPVPVAPTPVVTPSPTAAPAQSTAAAPAQVTVTVEATDCGAEATKAAPSPTAAPSVTASGCPAQATVTVIQTVTESNCAAPTAAPVAPVAAGNLQRFTGALGGIAAPAVTAGGRGFNVANNDSFVGLATALNRSCDVQHNKCANKANSGGGFSVGDCDSQNGRCKSV